MLYYRRGTTAHKGLTQLKGEHRKMPPCHRSKFRGGFSMPKALSDKRKNECQQCKNEHTKSNKVFEIKWFLVH